MTLKAALTPLGSVDHVQSDWLGPLRDVGITTAEELLGAGRSDPAGLSELLHVEPVEISRLLPKIEDELRRRGGLVTHRTIPKPPFGAWDPREVR